MIGQIFSIGPSGSRHKRGTRIVPADCIDNREREPLA